MKLFAVRHLHSRVPETGTYPNKAEARAVRDLLNGTARPALYVVTYGPEHRHFRANH